MENLPQLAHPLETLEDFNALLERIGDARVVCIGEASHGTSEFYRWRALLTERLIAEKGFSFVAVEGDWAECEKANAYALGQAGTQAASVLAEAFYRWPSWLWANREVEEFVEWLQGYNSVLPKESRVEFHGLDLYGLWDSLDELGHYAALQDSPGLNRLYTSLAACFAEFQGDAQSYGFAASRGHTSCVEHAERLHNYLLAEWAAEGNRAQLHALQHALVVRDAAIYYRAMYESGTESWNVRDRHMMDALDLQMKSRGRGAKAIVWAHNTHVGDARYTDMAWSGEVNVGQLARERYGREAVVLIGMGTYEGSVIAADVWGEHMQHMLVPPAQQWSWEHMLKRLGVAQSYFLSRDMFNMLPALQPKGHRAIGVVYDPLNERGNYVPSVIPLRYDVFLYFPLTSALHPLHAFRGEEGELPQYFPTGV